MPNLQKLIDGGVMGNVASLPPMLSPILWTSIATGKRADKHGILGFAEPDIENKTCECALIYDCINSSELFGDEYSPQYVLGWSILLQPLRSQAFFLENHSSFFGGTTHITGRPTQTTVSSRFRHQSCGVWDYFRPRP